jgi:hypothetical protein
MPAGGDTVGELARGGAGRGAAAHLSARHHLPHEASALRAAAAAAAAALAPDPTAATAHSPRMVTSLFFPLRLTTG